MGKIIFNIIILILLLSLTTCKKNDDELYESIIGYWEEHKSFNIYSARTFYHFDEDSVSEAHGRINCEYDISDFNSKRKYFIIDRYLYIQEDSKKFTKYKIKFLRKREANIYTMNIYEKKLKIERFDGSKRVFIKCN